MKLPLDPVVYEIYVRSFADSDGDGIGDLSGTVGRLDHLADLGVDAIWLTPIFASPQVDFGYDVSDFQAIEPMYGTMNDLDLLLREAHDRGIAVLLDMILAHTSKEHAWFRSRPEMYIWSDRVPNNWRSAFGGSAWTRDTERGVYYYHRYFPEQPALNWTNPEVRTAMHDVMRFWVDKGVDGFRLDAFDGIAVDPLLRDEPAADPALLGGRMNDSWADYWRLDHIHTTDLPLAREILRDITAAFPDSCFVVEVDLPVPALRPYAESTDSVFAFDFIRAPLNGCALGEIIDGAGERGNLAWALSNHDQPRLVSRWGRDLAAAAAVLLLSLPGWSFVYQGDEIGMVDGPGGSVVHDRSGRDAVRHPMQWTGSGGFSTGVPWLPYTDPEVCNVEDQRGRAGSMLSLYQQLIHLRRQLRGPVTVLESTAGRITFCRGDHVVDVNLGDTSVPVADRVDVMLATQPISAGHLPARGALIGRL
jgi:alpha-glucosidase